MKRIIYRRWTLDVNPSATRQAYESVERRAPEVCGCDPCRNFVAADAHIYPKEVLRLFEECGVHPLREAEVYHLARIEEGRHQYGGWLHIVGRIQSGRDSIVRVDENTRTFDLEEVGADFSIGLTSEVALVQSAFSEEPLVQVEFHVIVPWVLAACQEPL